MSSPNPKLDLQRAPTGERSAAWLVEAVAALGDLAEHHYLELKGPADLESRADKAKIAKYILGSANRLPERAAAAFQGYGVMVIGITEKGIEGVPPVETVTLAKVIDRFLGPAGPHWDIVRVPVAKSTNSVIVVLVDPPQIGQQPFICRANGEGLQDGRIYVRGKGETREANSGELDLLLARGRAKPAAPIELEISILGPVMRVQVEEDRTLNEYIAKISARLIDALPAPVNCSLVEGTEALGLGTDASGGGFAQAMQGPLTPIFELPENRSEPEYRSQIEAWAGGVRTAWPDAIDALAARLFSANEITVVNRAKTFVEDLVVSVHLGGTIEVLDRTPAQERPTLTDLGLPSPPRTWGPKKIDIGLGIRSAHLPSLADSLDVSPVILPDVSWQVGESVDLEVHVGDLRPESTFQSHDDSAILISRHDLPESFDGTWNATIRGHDEVYRGTLTASVETPTTLTSAMRLVLGLE